MKGLNSVKMRGYLMYPKLSVTVNGTARFNGKVSIPVVYTSGGEEKESKVYYNLCAWGAIAEALGELLQGTPIEIDGHLNTRSYEGACKSCGSPDKKYWTEVQVNNFTIVME